MAGIDRVYLTPSGARRHERDSMAAHTLFTGVTEAWSELCNESCTGVASAAGREGIHRIQAQTSAMVQALLLRRGTAWPVLPLGCGPGLAVDGYLAVSF